MENNLPTKNIKNGANGMSAEDLKHLESMFHDWFNAFEGYAFKSERFYDDLECDDDLRRSVLMINWMNAAFNAGYEKGKEDASRSMQ